MCAERLWVWNTHDRSQLTASEFWSKREPQKLRNFWVAPIGQLKTILWQSLQSAATLKMRVMGQLHFFCHHTLPGGIIRHNQHHVESFLIKLTCHKMGKMCYGYNDTKMRSLGLEPDWSSNFEERLEVHRAIMRSKETKNTWHINHIPIFAARLCAENEKKVYCCTRKKLNKMRVRRSDLSGFRWTARVTRHKHERME
jgi:hypothetical protein